MREKYCCGWQISAESASRTRHRSVLVRKRTRVLLHFYCRITPFHPKIHKIDEHQRHRKLPQARPAELCPPYEQGKSTLLKTARGSKIQRSDRGEELVQIERQRVELCAPRVFLVAPELVPPVVAPVLPRVFHLYRVVQDVGHQPSDEGLR